MFNINVEKQTILGKDLRIPESVEASQITLFRQMEVGVYAIAASSLVGFFWHSAWVFTGLGILNFIYIRAYWNQQKKALSTKEIT